MRKSLHKKKHIVGFSLRNTYRALARLLRQIKYHPASVPATSTMCLAVAVVYLLSASHVALATGSWTQTDWSGGQGGSTVNQYSSVSNADTTTTSGKTQLSKTEKFTNTSQDGDSTSWNTNQLYATPTVIQLKSVGSATAAVTSVTATFDSTPTQGNSIIAALAVQGTGVITLPSGYTTEFDYRI